MLCFNCQNPIENNIYKGWDKSFCSHICRNKIYYFNSEKDPYFIKPECWLKNHNEIELLERGEKIKKFEKLERKEIEKKPKFFKTKSLNDIIIKYNYDQKFDYFYFNKFNNSCAYLINKLSVIKSCINLLFLLKK